jgi:hypothetical protein
VDAWALVVASEHHVVYNVGVSAVAGGRDLIHPFALLLDGKMTCIGMKSVPALSFIED